MGEPERWMPVIDDDEDIRDTIRMLLELKGFRVATAGDGAGGLARLRATPPPVPVILDRGAKVRFGLPAGGVVEKTKSLRTRGWRNWQTRQT